METATLSWDGIVHPLPSPCAWEDVVRTANKFEGLTVNESFYVDYMDEEEDVIKVSGKESLVEALAWARGRNHVLCLRVPFPSPYSDDDDDSNWDVISEILDEDRPREALEPAQEQVETPTVKEESVPNEDTITQSEGQQEATPSEVNETGSKTPSEDATAQIDIKVMRSQLTKDLVTAFEEEVVELSNKEQAKFSPERLRELVSELLTKNEDARRVMALLQNEQIFSSVKSVMVQEIANPGSSGRLAISQALSYANELGETFVQVPLLQELLLEVLKSLNAPAGQEDQIATPEVVPSKVRPVHCTTKCDGCEQTPLREVATSKGLRDSNGAIVGVRYKSAVVEDFDLCESCEESGLFQASHGPFLKIVTPEEGPDQIILVKGEQSPLGMMVTEFMKSKAPLPGTSAVKVEPKPSAPEETPNKPPFEPHCKHPLKTFETPHHGFVCDHCQTRQQIKSVMHGCRLCNFDVCAPCNEHLGLPLRVERSVPQAKFVSDETLTDGSTVSPGEKVMKVWRIRNSGTETWPMGTRICHVGGESLGGSVQGIVVPLARPNQLVDVAIPLLMPTQPGRYTSYWRMVTPAPQQSKFGHRFWVTVNVVAPKPVEQPSDSLSGYDDAIARLVDLGFTDINAICRVLKEVDGNEEKAIDRLLEN